MTPKSNDPDGVESVGAAAKEVDEDRVCQALAWSSR